MNLWSKRLPKGKAPLSSPLDSVCYHPQVVFLVYKAWRRYGAQNLTTWTRLAQAVLDNCLGTHMARLCLQVPDACSICLGDALAENDAMRPFSLALPPPTLGGEQHVPPLQNTRPSKSLLDTALSPRKWENDCWKGMARDQCRSPFYELSLMPTLDVTNAHFIFK
ncbi:hypothetical protein TNCV_2773341 [Trichonephila clavipes]|nr:hypothetical protein TNCV_2773341 [Trichonephila clavipes]